MAMVWFKGSKSIMGLGGSRWACLSSQSFGRLNPGRRNEFIVGGATAIGKPSLLAPDAPKTKPFKRVLPSLGIKETSPKKRAAKPSAKPESPTEMAVQGPASTLTQPNVEQVMRRVSAMSTSSLMDAPESPFRAVAPARWKSAASSGPHRPQLLGLARTVALEGDIRAVLSGLAEAQPGEVLVVDAGITPPEDVIASRLPINSQLPRARSMPFGDFVRSESRRKRLAGIIIGGNGRAVELLLGGGGATRASQSMDAADTAVAAVKCGGRTQTTVQLGGATIAPYDCVMGDDSGVVVAPAAALREWMPALIKCTACHGQGVVPSPTFNH